MQSTLSYELAYQVMIGASSSTAHASASVQPASWRFPMAVLWLGVDVAQASLVSALWSDGQAIRLQDCPNTPAGFLALASQLEQAMQTAQASCVHVILEPTGGYELAFAAFALGQGCTVSRPNPAQVREWARGRGYRAKTDQVDARMLAHYGAEVRPPRWQPVPAEVSELELLLRRKEDLEQLLRQEQNRKHALGQRPGVPEAVGKSLERVIGALEQELDELEQTIKRHLGQHAELRRVAKRLRSVPGIGAKNVLWVLVVLTRWQTLTEGQGDAKGLVAYAGLDPQAFASGSSVQKRASISRKGERMMRRRLFLGALGGVRGKNVLRTFYQRLVGRGKAKKAALIAAARKILVWAWAVFRDQTTFDPTKITRDHALPS
jgi:transposase